MEESRLRRLLQAASDIGIVLEEKQVLLLLRYGLEIAAWNEKINLLSRSSSGDAFLKNVIDSLAVLPLLPGDGGAVLDMGAGGGFPGIPLKIARADLKVSLLEANRRKTSFLKHVIRTLQLEGITVLHERAENLREKEACRGAFDVVISKAAFKLPEFLRLGAFCLAPSGILIAMKGKQAGDEIDKARSAALASGLYLAASHAVALPVAGERRILIYRGTDARA